MTRHVHNNAFSPTMPCGSSCGDFCSKLISNFQQNNLVFRAVYSIIKTFKSEKVGAIGSFTFYSLKTNSTKKRNFSNIKNWQPRDKSG